MKIEQRHRRVKRFLEEKHKLRHRLIESLGGDSRQMSKVVQEVYLRIELADRQLIDSATTFEDKFWEQNAKQKPDPNKKVNWHTLR